MAIGERHPRTPWLSMSALRGPKPGSLYFCREQLTEVLIELTDRIGIGAE